MAQTNVLLLGRTGFVIDDVKYQLRVQGIRLFSGSGIDDVRDAFAQADIDHVIMGAGIDLETRLEIVREVLLSSAKTTIHMKDQGSGPQNFLPFVESMLRGLHDYESRVHAIPR